MKITDRPGRAFALIIMSPTLLIIANNIFKDYKIEGLILALFGIGLFCYELFWVLNTKCEIIKN